MSSVQLGSCCLPQCPRTEQPPRKQRVRPGGQTWCTAWEAEATPGLQLRLPGFSPLSLSPNPALALVGMEPGAELDRPEQEGGRWWCLGHISVAQSKHLLPSMEAAFGRQESDIVGPSTPLQWACQARGSREMAHQSSLNTETKSQNGVLPS